MCPKGARMGGGGGAGMVHPTEGALVPLGAPTVPIYPWLVRLLQPHHSQIRSFCVAPPVEKYTLSSKKNFFKSVLGFEE